MRGAAARLHERLQSLRGLVRGASVSVGLDGPGASFDLGRPGRPRPVDIAAQVAEAGANARRTAEPAMIVVDDLHEWSPSELRNLSEGLDRSSRAGHPIGLIASSSPAGDEFLTRADRNGVFDVHRLSVLSPGEASEVLTATASQRGVTFDQASSSAPS
jgi:hypothetical protein